MTVAPDGTDDFTTLQAAVDAAPAGENAPTVIRLRIGEYREKVHITKSNLRIVGDSAERAVIVFGDSASQTYPDGKQKGTFLSYKLRRRLRHSENGR